MAVIDFNSEDAPEPKGFEPLPAGEYQVVVIDSDYKATSKGDGHYLSLTFEVLEGEHKGRKVWENLNIDNPNDQAAGIARSRLRQLCEAVNIKHVKDSFELHNLPLIAKIVKKKDPYKGEVNVIHYYASLYGETQVSSTSKPAPNKPKDTAQPGTQAPWKKQKQSA